MMKLHVLKKAPLALLLLLAGLLLVTGCSSNGGDGGDDGLSVGEVEEVSLSGTVSTGDFGGDTGTGLPPQGDKNAALEAALSAIAPVGYSISSFLEQYPDWIDNQSTLSYTANPSNFEDWETASSVSLDATMNSTSMDLSQSTGESGTVTFEANASMSADIATFADEYGTNLDRLKGSLRVGDVLVTASDVYSTDLDAPPQTVNAAKAYLAINANLDVDPIYDTSSGYAEMSQLDAAAAVSVALAIAVSADGPGDPDFGGNFIIEAEYSDSATLSITEALANDPAALEEYLNDRLNNQAFSLRIRVYNGTTLRDDFTYTIDEIVSFIEGQEQV